MKSSKSTAHYIRVRITFEVIWYIKSKPAKYDLKIFMLNDSSTYYLFNAMPYIGKSALEKEEEEKEKQAKRKKKKKFRILNLWPTDM